jgi:hypothetical protein
MAFVTESDQLSICGQPLPPNWRELVGPDPNRPGPDRARLLEHGIAVWAIVGYLQAIGDEVTAETIAKTAEDYMVPVTAVTVALAYYDEHRAAIDTRLEINAAAVE